MIQAILAETYNASNEFTATITVPSGRYNLATGFTYKLGMFYYEAIRTNLVTRFSLTEDNEDLPDGIISGFNTVENGTEDGVIVSGGSYRYLGVVYTVNTPTNLGVNPVTDPDESRYDVVYGDPSPPDIDLVEGVESVDGQAPELPNVPSGTVALAYILVTDDGITVINLNPVPVPSLPALRLTYPTGSTNPIVIDMIGDHPEYGSDPTVEIGIQSGLTVTPTPNYVAVRTYNGDGVLTTLTIDTLNDPTLEDLVVSIKP
jgi:hypothetical protein